MSVVDVPHATTFERELSDQIAKVWGGGSGTVWRPAAQFVAHHLGLKPEDVGLISVTDSGVINNRPLSAGLITSPRKLVIIPVADEVGLSKEEQAIVELMPKTRHLTTVALAALADAGDGSSQRIWRVQRLIEIDGIGIADAIQHHFPMVHSTRREPLVPIGSESSEPSESDRIWLVRAAPPRGATSAVLIPPTDPSRRWFCPGDDVLLCDAALRRAHAVGRISSLSLDGSDLRVLIHHIVVFPTPIALEATDE